MARFVLIALLLSSFYGLNEKENRRLPNLNGSPLVYSHSTNRFIAVSCGFFASVINSDGHAVGGCMSTSDDHTTFGCIGINCCQVILPPYLTAIATEIIQYEEISTGDKYAFLIEQESFSNNLSSFRAIHDVDSVPVVLDWSFVLDNSSFKTFERFIANTKPIISLNVSASIMDWAALSSIDEYGSTPYCIKYDASPSSANNMSRLQCFCPSGFQGNPYLLQPCQDIDECQDPDQCKGPYIGIWESLDAKYQNFVGGHECYSNVTGYVCKYFASGGFLCYSNKSTKSQTSRIFKPIISAFWYAPLPSEFIKVLECFLVYEIWALIS